MSIEKTLMRGHYDSDHDDPRIRDGKSWLNARSALARNIIKKLRRDGLNIPDHNQEFVIGCAAPFRNAQQVTPKEMEEVVREMIDLYIRLGHFKEELRSVA